MAQIVIAIISFVGGWFAGKVLDYSFDTIIEAITRRLRKRKIKGIGEDTNADIQMLCTGVPCFTPDNIYVEIDCDANLYLGFPEDLIDSVPKSSGGFRNKDVLFVDIVLPGYDKECVSSAIETAKRKVAEMFITRSDGLFFNGKKYGVAYADGFSRTADCTEDPILTLKLFNTDHYTHRVLSEVVNNLHIDKKQLNQKMLNSELQWMRTSLGISVIVVLKSTNQIIMTRRSTNASYSEGKTWIYVSATETFTETDYDHYTHCADLMLCVKRGIQEELGITQNMYFDSTIKFYDMFYETHFFQDGIVASVELKENTMFDEVKALSAKDKQLEVDSLFVIDNSKKSIEEFIRENRTQMRSQTIFALKSHMARLRK